MPASDEFVVWDVNDPTKQVALDLSGITTGNTRILIPPDANAHLAALDVSQVWVGSIQTFVGTTYATNDIALQASHDSPSLEAWMRVIELSSNYHVDLSAALGGLTGNRVQRLPDSDGQFVLVGDVATLNYGGTLSSVEPGAATAAIGATNLTVAALAGLYRVSYYLQTTTSQAGAATVQFQINYTDDVGATTQASSTLTLTATGRTSGVFEAYLASGNITYQTNVGGVIGAGQYTLHARVESLG